MAHAPGPWGRMNKTEAARYRELLALEDSGEIMRGSIMFEEVKFRLADRTWYTPDFLYVLRNGRIVVEEIKGYAAELQHREDGWIKAKAVADKYGHLASFVVLIALKKKDGGGWERRELA